MFLFKVVFFYGLPQYNARALFKAPQNEGSKIGNMTTTIVSMAYSRRSVDTLSRRFFQADMKML
jgi:hypothetical protein